MLKGISAVGSHEGGLGGYKLVKRVLLLLDFRDRFYMLIYWYYTKNMQKKKAKEAYLYQHLKTKPP